VLLIRILLVTYTVPS